MRYTASVLASESHEMYWYQWTENDGLTVDGDIQLFKRNHYMAYMLSSTVISLLVLAAYGFKIWAKY
jgi:hypothetical protein